MKVTRWLGEQRPLMGGGGSGGHLAAPRAPLRSRPVVCALFLIAGSLWLVAGQISDGQGNRLSWPQPPEDPDYYARTGGGACGPPAGQQVACQLAPTRAHLAPPGSVQAAGALKVAQEPADRAARSPSNHSAGPHMEPGGRAQAEAAGGPEPSEPPDGAEMDEEEAEEDSVASSGEQAASSDDDYNDYGAYLIYDTTTGGLNTTTSGPGLREEQGQASSSPSLGQQRLAPGQLERAEARPEASRMPGFQVVFYAATPASRKGPQRRREAPRGPQLPERQWAPLPPPARGLAAGSGQGSDEAGSLLAAGGGGQHKVGLGLAARPDEPAALVPPPAGRPSPVPEHAFILPGAGPLPAPPTTAPPAAARTETGASSPAHHHHHHHEAANGSFKLERSERPPELTELPATGGQGRPGGRAGESGGQVGVEAGPTPPPGSSQSSRPGEPPVSAASEPPPLPPAGGLHYAPSQVAYPGATRERAGAPGARSLRSEGATAQDELDAHSGLLVARRPDNWSPIGGPGSPAPPAKGPSALSGQVTGPAALSRLQRGRPARAGPGGPAAEQLEADDVKWLNRMNEKRELLHQLKLPERLPGRLKEEPTRRRPQAPTTTTGLTNLLAPLGQAVSSDEQTREGNKLDAQDASADPRRPEQQQQASLEPPAGPQRHHWHLDGHSGAGGLDGDAPLIPMHTSTVANQVSNQDSSSQLEAGQQQQQERLDSSSSSGQQKQQTSAQGHGEDAENIVHAPQKATGNHTSNIDTNNGQLEGLTLEHNVYYWRLIWFVLPLGATFGNLLVILAVYMERSLQSVTNYFIVSLAFADLFVGLIVMPFAVYVLWSSKIICPVNEVWELGDAICDIYVAVDVTCSTASILNLVAISIDRYRAVAHPISYSARSSNRRAIVTIVAVWLISCCTGGPIILGLNTSPDRKSSLCIFYNSTFIFWSSIISFYGPCIIMLLLYHNIFRAIRSRTKKAIQQGTHGPCATAATSGPLLAAAGPGQPQLKAAGHHSTRSTHHATAAATTALAGGQPSRPAKLRPMPAAVALAAAPAAAGSQAQTAISCSQDDYDEDEEDDDYDYDDFEEPPRSETVVRGQVEDTSRHSKRSTGRAQSLDEGASVVPSRGQHFGHSIKLMVGSRRRQKEKQSKKQKEARGCAASSTVLDMEPDLVGQSGQVRGKKQTTPADDHHRRHHHQSKVSGKQEEGEERISAGPANGVEASEPLAAPPLSSDHNNKALNQSPGQGPRGCPMAAWLTANEVSKLGSPGPQFIAYFPARDSKMDEQPLGGGSAGETGGKSSSSPGTARFGRLALERIGSCQCLMLGGCRQNSLGPATRSSPSSSSLAPDGVHLNCHCCPQRFLSKLINCAPAPPCRHVGERENRMEPHHDTVPSREEGMRGLGTNLTGICLALLKLEQRKLLGSEGSSNSKSQVCADSSVHRSPPCSMPPGGSGAAPRDLSDPMDNNRWGPGGNRNEPITYRLRLAKDEFQSTDQIFMNLTTSLLQPPSAASNTIRSTEACEAEIYWLKQNDNHFPTKKDWRQRPRDEPLFDGIATKTAENVATTASAQGAQFKPGQFCHCCSCLLKASHCDEISDQAIETKRNEPALSARFTRQLNEWLNFPQTSLELVLAAKCRCASSAPRLGEAASSSHSDFKCACCGTTAPQQQQQQHQQCGIQGDSLMPLTGLARRKTHSLTSAWPLSVCLIEPLKLPGEQSEAKSHRAAPNYDGELEKLTVMMNLTERESGSIGSSSRWSIADASMSQLVCRPLSADCSPGKLAKRRPRLIFCRSPPNLSQVGLKTMLTAAPTTARATTVASDKESNSAEPVNESVKLNWRQLASSRENLPNYFALLCEACQRSCLILEMVHCEVVNCELPAASDTAVPHRLQDQDKQAKLSSATTTAEAQQHRYKASGAPGAPVNLSSATVSSTTRQVAAGLVRTMASGGQLRRISSKDNQAGEECAHLSRLLKEERRTSIMKNQLKTSYSDLSPEEEDDGQDEEEDEEEDEEDEDDETATRPGKKRRNERSASASSHTSGSESSSSGESDSSSGSRSSSSLAGATSRVRRSLSQSSQSSATHTGYRFGSSSAGSSLAGDGCASVAVAGVEANAEHHHQVHHLGVKQQHQLRSLSGQSCCAQLAAAAMAAGCTGCQRLRLVAPCGATVVAGDTNFEVAPPGEGRADNLEAGPRLSGQGDESRATSCVATADSGASVSWRRTDSRNNSLGATVHCECSQISTASSDHCSRFNHQHHLHSHRHHHLEEVGKKNEHSSNSDIANEGANEHDAHHIRQAESSQVTRENEKISVSLGDNSLVGDETEKKGGEKKALKLTLVVEPQSQQQSPVTAGVIQNAREKIKRRSVRLGRLIPFRLVKDNLKECSAGQTTTSAQNTNSDESALSSGLQIGSVSLNAKSLATNTSGQQSTFGLKAVTLVEESSNIETLDTLNPQAISGRQTQSATGQQVIATENRHQNAIGGSQNSDIANINNPIHCHCSRKGSGKAHKADCRYNTKKHQLDGDNNLKDLEKQHHQMSDRQGSKSNMLASVINLMNPIQPNKGSSNKKQQQQTPVVSDKIQAVRHKPGSRRRREKNAAKRERKATKTLAIVLGVFLFCWTPFFTCNIIDGICIQLEMDCRPSMSVYLATSWLGYINSCVNPIIYTIFNMEFRRAFKRILTTSPTCCNG